MGLEGYKLTGKEREEFLKESQRIAEEQMERKQLQTLYDNYVEYGGMPPEAGYRFQENFLKLINYINRKIHELKEEGKISECVEVRARIKGIQSAIKNHNKEKKNFATRITNKLENKEEYIKAKTLDDIFGIEILCVTEDEIELIKEELEKFLSKVRDTKHHEITERNYKAQHDEYSLKSEIMGEDGQMIEPEKMPIVECQYKTFEVAKNCMDHAKYKGTNMEEVQKQYDNGEFMIGDNLPTMYVSSYDSKGNPIMRKLNLKETLRKEYPKLDMSQKNKARD